MSIALDISPLDKSELIANRRWLHQNPELKFQEHKSSCFIAEKLTEFGYKIQTNIAKTGVVALADTMRPGPTLMLRADMDALPVKEENSLDYVSTNNGVMHACGHDGHMAMLLSAAKQLSKITPELSGKLKLVFQPGEEGGNGALRMIEEGVLESPKVDAAFGIHLWNGLPVGTVGVINGPVMASVDEFNIVVKGRGGHGAMPHQTIDAILAACQIVTSLQTVVSRNVNPLDSAVVTVGSIRAGEAFNVIAEEAFLRGTVRTFSNELYKEIPDIFNRVVTHTAAALGAECTIKYERLGPPTINNLTMADFVRQIASEVVGKENVISDDRARTMAGEDMAYFLARVPGCFFFVGSQNESKGLTHPHHSPFFNFDEEALPIGVEILKRITTNFLKHGEK
ncbi:MAG: amidohydrolase [Acidobacteria bacterium]|nr:amidohydrolase [Acidobacteriota bacterium]